MPLGLATTLFVVGHGVLVVAGGGSGWSSGAERIAVGMLQVLAGAAMTAGLVLGAKVPRAGVVFVAAGVVVISALWHWALVITIPVGLGLVAITYLRGARTRSISSAQLTRPRG